MKFFFGKKFFGIAVDPYLSKLQRNLSGRSTFFVWVERSILKMTEQSDIHKSSIFNLQSSIPACPGWVIGIYLIFGACYL
jgi:hypothetical protein